MKHFLGWRPKHSIIEPKHSIIIELLANEIVRFPRCKRFRLKEIQEKFKYKSNHMVRTAAEIALIDDQPKKKRKINRQRNIPTVMNKFRPADVSNIEIISNIFEDKEFCVLNGMEMCDNTNMENDCDDDLRRFDKQELEKLIA